MLTIRTAALGLRGGELVLDLGCGVGRHAFELYRHGARVVALDHGVDEVTQTAGMFAAMAGAGEAPEGATATAMRADALRLPFADASFDVVVAAEVLEHLVEDARAVAEIARVLRPGGVLAVSVPRWWPERICWALSRPYHEVAGGHVRIYRRRGLLGRLRGAGLRPVASHHAHALHAPYWWLKCAFGVENDTAALPRWYHRFLVYDIMCRPVWTRLLERALNPVLGKSLVVYLTKPGGVA